MKVFLRKFQPAGDERGVTLVAVAIVAFFVALVALTTLALTKAQVESVDDQTDVQHATLSAEIGGELALRSIRLNDSDNLPIQIEGLREMTREELTDTLRDPEINSGVVYDEDPQKSFYTAMETLPLTQNSAADFRTIQGNSEEADITYVDDSTLVKDSTEYDYQNRLDESYNWVVSLGETRRSESDARTSLSAKGFVEENKLFERRVVQTQVFNENHPDPPYIESKHDSYDINIDRSWVVSYTADPGNPNRNITGIDVLIRADHLGLGSAGDTLSFSTWNGTEFDPAFDVINGPIAEDTIPYESNSPIPTTAIKVNMRTDNYDDSTNDAANYGFKISGIKYHYDSDLVSALYETPHPYDGLETLASFGVQPQFTQVIYSPYALPQNQVNPIEFPGDDNVFVPPSRDGISAYDLDDLTDNNAGDQYTDPSNEKYYERLRLRDIGNNNYQVMRVHFDKDFSLETGDTLEVYNGNNGVMLTKYTGTTGANVFTPYAFRTNPDFPLAIVLVLDRDGDNADSTDNYGYKVDILEFSDEKGEQVFIQNPVQTTAHRENMGYNDGLAGLMRDSFVFKPGDPTEGGTVLNWKVVFNVSADLMDQVSDTDRVTLKRSSVISAAVQDLHFVSPDGFYQGDIGTNGYFSIEDLRNYTLDMENRLWLEIVTEFDNADSFTDDEKNHGWSISYLEVTYDDAVSIDLTPPRLRSSAITIKAVGEKVANAETVSYPAFGEAINNRGEWWVTSKDHEQILIHFDLESFRLEGGDSLDIYDQNGLLIKSLQPEGDDNIYSPGGIIFEDEDESSGMLDFEFIPNPPVELINSSGWIIVPTEAAQIVLAGDGSLNHGFSGFEIDRVAFWSEYVLDRNEMTDFSDEETDDYSITRSKSVDKFIKY